MLSVTRITSVRFSRYKAFRDFSLSIDRFNILVGPNNAGKSTILGAFRILAEAMRKAKSKSPTYVEGPDGTTLGYEVNLGNVPVATENVFHNYDEEHAPSVTFRISTGDSLILYFPRRGVCNLVCSTPGKAIKSPSAFRQRFGIEIGFVPILGPVEHNEQLYQKEAAREAILTHRASRNFRNIWHHYPEEFAEFRKLIQDTWPGMDVKQPEIDNSHEKPLLRMYCPEERRDREIYWAGFGFQVWCQMLTYMVVNRDATLFIIDEPDIYLHSVLQRQLVSALRALGPDILIATHSTEILLEADSNEILTVTKNAKSAKRMADPSQLRGVFEILGSNANPVLTQLARSKRVVFVEGKDFQVISRFANKLGAGIVATRSAFAVVPTEGFNPTKAKVFQEGVQATMGSKIEVAIIFDRDYRSDAEVEREIAEMKQFSVYAHIHSRKELENFLLIPDALERAIGHRLAERSKRTGEMAIFSGSAETVLERVS
jgi:energy-coupling factor transporter ATP-binding protein EcfA2